MWKICLIILFSFTNLVSSSCIGCVDLDELTFEKVVNKFKTSLVKFDQSFPYGENHEAFAAFSQQINNKTLSETDHPDILIGVVGIKDYGELDNKKLAESFGVKVDSLPAIKLFVNGDLKKPINFEIGTEKLTTSRLFKFLKKYSSTYLAAPGCVQELDSYANSFMKDRNKQSEILKSTEDFINKIECKEKKNLVKLYVSLMKGVIDKGSDFIAKQEERMTKLLKDKLSDKKIEEINKKLNIIASFKAEEDKEVKKDEF